VAQASGRKLVVCNADESEPGTFKDRVLLELDPFSVLEGLVIAGETVGAERGYVYLRGEYPLAARRMEHAIGEARRAGWLGERFDVELRRGAGAYICGEETALFNSIEGKRGEPRNKPPFPTQAGLFGRPTLVNNVETLANVPLLLEEGDAFRGGPKLYCVSGQVARPGLYELPFATTLRELLALAGVEGTLQAVLLGGAAGSFVGPEALDATLSLDGLRAVGASLGSGVVFVVCEGTELLDLALRIARFFRDESCGQCVPCRVGTQRQEEALVRLRERGSDERALVAELGRVMRDASICGLGHTASSAVESALALLARRKDKP
jgi:NADH-quinone oxidoreductase subunit F